MGIVATNGKKGFWLWRLDLRKGNDILHESWVLDRLILMNYAYCAIGPFNCFYLFWICCKIFTVVVLSLSSDSKTGWSAFLCSRQHLFKLLTFEIAAGWDNCSSCIDRIAHLSAILSGCYSQCHYYLSSCILGSSWRLLGPFLCLRNSYIHWSIRSCFVCYIYCNNLSNCSSCDCCRYQ